MTDEEKKRAVAEKVMGWDILNNKMTEGPYLFYGTVYLKRIDFYPFTEWNPINNPAHWMMVVERMISKGYSFLCSWSTYDKYWNAGFYKNLSQWFGDQNENLGHAICEAALRAVG